MAASLAALVSTATATVTATAWASAAGQATTAGQASAAGQATPAGAEGAAGLSPQQVPARVVVAEVLAPEQIGPRSLSPDHSDRDLVLAERLAYPLATPAEQIDPWGWRYSQARGAWRMHTGVDLAAAAGTPVLAALAGRVVLVEPLSGYGLTVVLEHADGIHTLYAHLQEATAIPGSQLAQGEGLGTVGMSGRASGPHLHFELRSHGRETLAHDPTPHLPPLLPPPALTATRP